MRMNRNLIIGIVVAVIVLGGGGAVLLANNSSSKKSAAPADTSKPMDMNTPSTASQESGNSQTPVATSSVTIKDFAFSPADITVKKGTTVTWTNMDSAAHTVTETDSKKGPSSGNLASGKSYSFTFDTAGTYAYHCAIHPNMVGTVTVTE